MSNALTMAGGGRTTDILTRPVEALAMHKPGAPENRASKAVVQNRHADLRRDQKAAIILRVLGSDASGLPFGDHDAPHMAKLVRAMAGLRHVDEATLLNVIREFLAEIASLGLYFRPGIEAATAALGTQITDNVRALLADAVSSDGVRDPWAIVALQPPEILATLLRQETPQVAALTLAKLPPGKAADLLAALPPEVARETTLAALGPDDVTEATISAIGNALAEAAEQAQRQGPLPGTAVDRVGAVLNFAPGQMRDDLLANLEAADSDLAEQVRRVMFTFADIPDRVEVNDVAKLVRAVPNDVMVRALAGAAVREKETADFLFSNLSKRLSEQLAEEVREVGEVKPKDADAAMNAVVQAVRDLEAAGEVVLILPGE